MENLPDKPIIFCRSHYELFGPIASTISLPVQFRLLVNVEILKPRENLLTGVRNGMSRLNERQIRLLCKFVSRGRKGRSGSWIPFP